MIRLKAVSMLTLFALVMSFVPAAVTASSASAAQACTDRAQFVADVTVPDGARYNPGEAFTKVWQLRNIGTCTWTTAYSLVFDSGEKMGATTSSNFANTIAPGQIIDITVNMTAPGTAGHYIGYWKFKNASGGLFGIGVQANKAWWVEINVVGTPTTTVAYDFVANATSATWSSGAGNLPFPGQEGDTRGFATTGLHWIYEDGRSAPDSAILVGPQNIPNGYIQGAYPAFTVQAGDIFKSQVGCQLAATSCYVKFRLALRLVDGTVPTPDIITIWNFNEKWDGRTNSEYAYPDIKLDKIQLNNGQSLDLVGRKVEFILTVNANGSPVGDVALWGNPVILRKGAGAPPPTVTGTPPTATPTSTPGPITVTVPPSGCDRVQFVADVNYSDGTLVAPGTVFTKTWRLKNVGSCQWTTSYQLVFFSGEQMSAPAAAAFPRSVDVGQTIDISVNLTAPLAAGSYRGFWMFKNAGGALFGIGAQANKPWWVDIKVSGPTVTPGGPSKTPTPTTTTGPSATPSPGVAYDFATNACAGTWFSGAGQLPCPGSEGDARGFALKVTSPKLETGATDTRPGILAYPQNVQNGYIQGFFPAFRVENGDRFRSVINCEGGATNCYAAFRLDYQSGTDPIGTFWGPFLERYEGQVYTVDVDLSPLAGRDVKFILTVLSAGTPVGDRALWVGPHIFRGTGGSALPDLSISSMSISFPNASCMNPGDLLGVRVNVVNGGQAPAGGFAVKVGDVQQSVTGLAVGESKSVFFTGYSNPVTAVVDSGGTVAESNEQNNSRSENVPVPTPPLPCNSPTPAPPRSTSTPTPTPAAALYQNVKYNFKFTLPTGATIVSQSDNAGRVNFTIAGGTNLTEKYVQVNVVENASTCSSPAVSSPPSSTENVTFNNIQFVKRTGQEGAAGNFYDWVAYSTTRNNACISLAFILHSLNPGNFPTPPPVFDKNAESAVFTQVMNSFNWITP